MTIKKVNLLFIIFISLLLVTAIMTGIVLRPLFLSPVTFYNKSDHPLTYQRSSQFEQYLEKWQVIPTKINLNPFSDRKKYRADRLEIHLVAQPPSDPDYELKDKSTDPPTTLASVQETVSDATLVLTIYQNKTPLLKSYEKNMTWLIIYMLYKKGHPYLSEEELMKELNPVYKELTSPSANFLLSSHE